MINNKERVKKITENEKRERRGKYLLNLIKFYLRKSRVYTVLMIK